MYKNACDDRYENYLDDPSLNTATLHDVFGPAWFGVPVELVLTVLLSSVFVLGILWLATHAECRK